MIRTVLTVDKQMLSFQVPASYIGKQVEVIAFTIDEGFKPSIKGKKQVSFTVLHVENNNYKFNRDEANQR
jgi:hypothetical protein